MQNLIIEKLTNHNIKPSVQRIAVYSYLVEKKNHPTVDMIYSDLHPKMPTLSKTTVFPLGVLTVISASIFPFAPMNVP